MFPRHWRPLRAISMQLCPSCVEYEEQFNSTDLFEYTVEHTELPIFAVTLYLGMIFYLPEYLGEPPGKTIIRQAWGIWNLALSIFSIFGASRTVPFLYSQLTASTNTGGFIFSVCGGNIDNELAAGNTGSEWYTTGPTGLWVGLFIYSKLPELLDTFFLVIQKKPVIFLHWFHHVTVLLYCWHAYHHRVASGIWFAAMNYCVHSIMYFYYFIMIFPSPKAVRKAAQRMAPIITTVQICQMVGGIIVTCTGAYQTIYHGKHCRINAANWKLGLAMYASYCVLFVILFYDKFLKAKSPNKGAVPDSKESLCNANVSGDTAGFFHGRLRRQSSNESSDKHRSPSPGKRRRAHTRSPSPSPKKASPSVTRSKAKKTQ